jgi:RHH-type proline utilization regulon transcriptional repressor/proline dehydrogenase/delta 1-pyrroline-5-carboxylate dehydrogenase
MTAIAFEAPYASDDAEMARELLSASVDRAIRGSELDLARSLLQTMRSSTSRIGGIEEILREYSISTKEGAALMVLAEALLRIPESHNGDRLIVEKLDQGDFRHHSAKSDLFFVAATAWALGTGAKVFAPGETAQGVVQQLVTRLGLPTVRIVARNAMSVLGNHFVLGQSIQEALERSRKGAAAEYRYSFDMLGEGARTRDDARKYLTSYAAAIEAIGQSALEQKLPDRPGISVKLSALHPRYEATNREKVLRELIPDVLALAQQAKKHDLNFTIDAEEADRLELSLQVIDRVFVDRSLRGWDGFGLAIQAYQKRALAVIRHVVDIADSVSGRLMVRLVKGAYWDTEVKRAQERGLPDYPVFTRKSMTDLNYLHCAHAMLSAQRLYPQFATHNAMTVAAITTAAGESQEFEFQRLYGMGDALYVALRQNHSRIPCRTYAPVGGHKDLLAYLVRRLLENGANSSFVMNAADPSISIDTLLKRPADIVARPENARHPQLPTPSKLFGDDRINSAGVEFGNQDSLDMLVQEIREHSQSVMTAGALINGAALKGKKRPVFSPVDGSTVGNVEDCGADLVDRAVNAAVAGFEQWSGTTPEQRAEALEKAAAALEANRGHLLHLLTMEAGKTLDDGVAEIREAVDFCRYYASEGRQLFSSPSLLPGPTGETNTLGFRARGPFVAISPWNFPLAIFVGQVVAALMAGNTVIAKPAEQTPLIASEAVRILHESEIPETALHLLLGDGTVGAQLVAHQRVAGVVFTGSTDVARSINRSLAAKDGPIVPFIAETGGINAMIVDSTALPEQVTDDVITSAFRSAGQRCSALRLLCVQEDVADQIVEMIIGAVRELNVGDPRDPASHLGPVIDHEAKENLDHYIQTMKVSSRVLYSGKAPATGYFVAPHIIALNDVNELKKEVFGPVLHVLRYETRGFDSLLSAIKASGYGLTLGIHSRLTGMAMRVVRKLPIGNVYVNRNMIGAVVGVQPFGGCGLSGTGPKAGGPNYLQRFATEQTYTVNTAAVGGNASLISMDDTATHTFK